MNSETEANKIAKKRLANKVIWNLEDIMGAVADARTAWRKAHKRAQKQMDPILLTSLATISDRLAEIERRARDARQGKYDGRME